MIHPLSDEEMSEYRRPFGTHSDRWPTLSWLREIPVGGEPTGVTGIMITYGRWLATSDIPKLFVNAEPGVVLTGALRDFCCTRPNQTEVTVPGVHFIREDSRPEIGRALGDWARKLAPKLRT